MPGALATLRAANDVTTTVTVEEIARALDTRVLQPQMAQSGVVRRLAASDRMSDLLQEATSTTLIVTALATTQVLGMAELMDAPGICITIPGDPPAGFLAGALRCRVPVILSRLGPAETVQKVRRLIESCGGVEG